MTVFILQFLFSALFFGLKINIIVPVPKSMAITPIASASLEGVCCQQRLFKRNKNILHLKQHLQKALRRSTLTISHSWRERAEPNIVKMVVFSPGSVMRPQIRKSSLINSWFFQFSPSSVEYMILLVSPLLLKYLTATTTPPWSPKLNR